MKKKPTIGAVRKVVEEHGAKQGVVLLFDGTHFAAISYGHTKASCARVGALLDRIVELINFGELPNPVEVEVEDERACVRCGCTQSRACPGGCSWIPGLKDVCSACATPAEFRSGA